MEAKRDRRHHFQSLLHNVFIDCMCKPVSSAEELKYLGKFVLATRMLLMPADYSILQLATVVFIA